MESSEMNTETFRRLLKEQIDEICEIRNWRSDDNRERGMAFQLWLADLFTRAYQGVDTDPDDAILQSKDLQVDVLLDDPIQQRLILIQAKIPSLRAKPKAISEDEVSSFFDRHQHLLDANWVKRHGSQRAFELLGDYKDRTEAGYAFSYFFVSTGRLTDKVSQAAEHKNQQFAKAVDSVTCTAMGINELRQFYSRTQSLEGALGVDVSEKIPRGQYFMQEQPHRTLVCSISGNWLRNLYHRRDVKERLFALNIRDWLGRRTSINKDITRTLEQEPHNFFYFNNGISAIATKLTIEEGEKTATLTAENFQIINGAQTVGAIAESTDAVSDAYVLMRVTESSSVKTQDRGINEKIIRYNNSQNAIRISDFRSNDQIQAWLEKHISPKKAKSHLPLITYQRRRGASTRTKAGSKILKLDDLAKIRYAFEDEPTLVINSPKDLFTSRADHSEGAYESAFGVNGRLEIVWPQEELRRAHLAIALHWEFAHQIKEEIRENESLRYLNQLRFHILALAGESCRRRMGVAEVETTVNNEKHFERFATRVWKGGRYAVTQEWKRNLEVKSESPMSIRTFARSSEKWNLIKSTYHDFQDATET